ncbi:YceI family protein [Ferrovum sp. PN-J185]|uniref:YceI family protein n=1 Tax=Ferrovum sp. PN-J185 TaxID=1356306 RepID=UPI001E412BAA|nr:YceI family protein [Ferrovum sp. PN-J185]MCC6067724.1 YceI family protein [Ferrovum sp. PN-J185]MDE1891350.1 YceI family protein [Betaproteobacteria bacterium]MDE2056124.1 YceI family protein [Betaproteobacteria bacterium]
MKKYRLYLVIIGTILSVYSTYSFAGIIPKQSKLQFTVKEEGAPVQGEFKSFNGDIHFDDSNPKLSHARLVVALASVDFASEETEDEAKGKNWFNVAVFPNAEFTSSNIVKIDQQHYQVEGVLSIKNIKKTIKIPLVLTRQGAQYVAEGQFVLSRGLFQIGQGVWADPDTVADAVTVQFHMVFTN